MALWEIPLLEQLNVLVIHLGVDLVTLDMDVFVNMQKRMIQLLLP